MNYTYQEMPFNSSEETITTSPQPYYPWRRFFARMFDLAIYQFIWSLILVSLFHEILINWGSLGLFAADLIAHIIMLFMEPLLLHLFGTTPGKAIFGLHLKNRFGKNLSYYDGLCRTWHVIGSGLGYAIPFYDLVRLWKCYNKCRDNAPLPWDDHVTVTYTIKDTKSYRVCCFIAARLVIIGLSVILTASQMFPPNRGDLTISEFVRNFNYYADYYGISFGDKYLDANGQWQKIPQDNAYIIDLFYQILPDYQFTLDSNGYITGISFKIEITDSDEWIAANQNLMILSSLAFMCAQKDIGLFSKVPEQITDKFNEKPFSDFLLTESGIKLQCHMETSGYYDAFHFFVPDENAEHNYYLLEYSIAK